MLILVLIINIELTARNKHYPTAGTSSGMRTKSNTGLWQDPHEDRALLPLFGWPIGAVLLERGRNRSLLNHSCALEDLTPLPRGIAEYKKASGQRSGNQQISSKDHGVTHHLLFMFKRDGDAKPDQCLLLTDLQEFTKAIGGPRNSSKAVARKPSKTTRTGWGTSQNQVQNQSTTYDNFWATCEDP